MKRTIGFITLFITLIVLLLTIGYAAFSDQLTITNSVSYIRSNIDLRVTNVTTNSSYVSDLNYGTRSIKNKVSIPSGGSIVYSVTVRNLGNVPVAASDVTFYSGNNVINDLSANITGSNYVKICNDNVCTNNVSKTFDVVVTNNGNTTLTTNLDAVLTFTPFYSVNYEGTFLGDALSENNFTYTFNNNPPSKLTVSSGSHSGYTYNNNILTITNVTSDIILKRVYTINYNGEYQGEIVSGGTYTYPFSEKWPKSITGEGTYDKLTYVNDVLTITNVNSDVSCTGEPGKISITNITYNSSTNATEKNPATFDGMTANFDVIFKREENATTNDFQIVYDVTINNEYYNDYIFNGFDFDSEITKSSDNDNAYMQLSLDGVNQGDTIPARTSKSFKLILTLIANNPNGTYGVEGGTEAETTEPTVEEGTLTATITPSGGDLRSNVREQFTIEYTNTYTSDKEFRLLSSNSNLQLVDSANNSLGTFTASASTTGTYTVYVKTNDNAMFSTDTATTNIILSSSGMANVSIGTLTFNVDVSAGVDITPVSVSGATMEMVYVGSNTYPTVGSIKVSWQRDDVGGSDVVDYTVMIYGTKDNNPVQTKHTNSGLTNLTFTDLADDTYYVIVYGEDAYHNSGASYVSQATTSPYAEKSGTKKFQWTFNVDISGLDNLKCDNTVAYLGQTYTCNMTAIGSYRDGDLVPSRMTSVYMGGASLTTSTSATSYYSYRTGSSTTATLKIFNVTDTPKLTATAGSSTCLIEETEILLANGTYKRIENIDYDDLLMVYNYETGKFAYEYPIWIEKTKSTKSYQENVFSDGTVLNTLGWHGLFETELNRFVSVDNPKEFHVGSKIAKLNKDKSGYDTVTVTNIEYKNETVNYYHVVSTRYYNIIANDLLTTDGTVILSNLYGFTDQMTWPEEIREEAIKDVYSYDELSDAIPYYMFKGLRAEEGKFLSRYGLDLETFKKYLIRNQNNPEMVKQPIQRFNKNVWMVTTSEDNVTELNKDKFLRYEDSTYTLPKSKNSKFAGWLNTSDNKIYYPGDKVTVYHGMYFEGIYK